MICLKQNQACVARDRTGLTTSEVFSKLIMQVLFCGEKLTNILVMAIME